MNLKFLRFGNFYLLVALLLFLFLYSFLLEYHLGRAIVTIFFAGVFFASIYAIGKNKRWLWIAVVFTIIAVGTKWFAYLTGSSLVLLVSDSVNIICFAFIAMAILARVLKDGNISINDILGAICVYLLIGLTWAFLFSTIDYLNSGAFRFMQCSLDSYQKLPHLIYLSFITLTSTGYGDIYPVSPIAQLSTYIEAIVGQIYMVVLIGWMVGIYVAHSTKKEKPSSEIKR